MKSITFLVFLILPLWSFAFVRVGNSGEGVLQNNKIYVLDLYEAGTHEKPWVGNNILPGLRARFEKSSKLTRLLPASETLLRKLSDLESLVPGLGYAVTEVLAHQSFHWVNTLDLVENEVAGIPTESRIQLAVRNDAGIYLSQSAWNRLDAVSRAALLIHEGIYTIAKFDCQNNYCAQRSAVIRPLVGELFQSHRLTDFAKRADQILEIPGLSKICDHPIQIQFGILDYRIDRYSKKIHPEPVGGFQRHYKFLDKQFRSDVAMTCSEALRLRQGSLEIAVTVSRLYPFVERLERMPHYLPQPPVSDRGRMTVRMKPFTKKAFVRVQKQNDCEILVSQAVNDLYVSDEVGMVNPRHLCE